jgi:predicted lipoprotein with Yx(FWY)xxD motif
MLSTLTKYTVMLLLLSACGGKVTPSALPPSEAASSGPSPAAAASPPAEATPPTVVALRLADSRYGKIIVDGPGRALYLFDADRSTVSTCYTACATAWPPFVMTQPPTAGPGLAQALTSTTTRNDGSKQVTYNGHPLYYYIGDAGPGQVNCQAVVEFGGGWYVLDGQGNKISSA